MGSGPNIAGLTVNHNINQLLNEHDSVTLVVKTLTKITREHRKICMGIKGEVWKPNGQESWLKC
jgi:hypothetical protein